MKVLVATSETQGQRGSDLFFAEEGELVTFVPECEHELHDIDDSCGCMRTMIGLDTTGLTTTMKVLDLDMTRDVLEDKLRHRYEVSGWAAFMTTEALDEQLEEDMRALTEIAKQFSPGAVIEKRGDEFEVRELH